MIQMTIENCWMLPFFHLGRQKGTVLRTPSSADDQRNDLFNNFIQLSLYLSQTVQLVRLIAKLRVELMKSLQRHSVR